jgi:translation initiation factor 1A
MVKNTKGGNKAKKQARKSANASVSTKARCSEHEDEIYACCSKLLGNGMCNVMCIDGVERICIIRNKFRGKGKRGNTMSTGVWCLVGRRDFEKPKEGKLEKTDLLEVYNEIEKKYIMQSETGLKDKWKLFNTIGTNYSESVDDEVVNFHKSDNMLPEESDEEEQEYENENEIENEIEAVNSPSAYDSTNLGDVVDINDI